ncbi:MAG: InlB B-repeat-containing protein [Dehalococcoidia bacterium]
MIERRRRRISAAVALTMAAVLITGAVATAYVSADGIPPWPHGFSGTVSTLNPLQLVPQGTLVQAFLDGVKKADDTVDAQGKYSLLVPGPGTTVTFKVAGVTAHQSATWVAGETYSDFNLTIDALPGPVYTLTISSTSGGSVTSPGEATYSYPGGTVVSLVASPDTGYKFVNWTGSVATIANPDAATTTITMQGNYSITANFAQDVPATQYDLNITSTSGGSVTTPGAGTFQYDEGTVVSLVATPDSGYRFVNWTGDVTTVGNTNAASTTITMQGDYSITASFEEGEPPVQYQLSVNSTSGGSVTAPGEGAYEYDEGTAVSLVAAPDSGYQFVNWTGNVSTIANTSAASTTITMEGNYSITATFQEGEPPVQYSLTISSTSGGSVTSPGEGTFNYSTGTAVSLLATADDGYEFATWTGDVATIANINSASTTITVNGNYTITAEFQEESVPSSGWCFIATAAYGTPMAREIQVLREFRDGYLLTNRLGEDVVDLYYRFSPPVAEFITRHPHLKPIVRVALMPAVAISAVIVSTSPAQKAALAGAALMLSAAVAMWLTRRRCPGADCSSA